MIATIVDILKQWEIGHYIYVQKTKHLPSHRVDVRGMKRCRPLLRRLIPFLVTRREEAEILLALIDKRLTKATTKPLTSDETDALRQIKELKHRRHLRDFQPCPFYSKGEDKVRSSDESGGDRKGP